MSERAELKCKIHQLNSLSNKKYVVICSFYEGKFLLSKHKKRDTWETQGGHIEKNETPFDAAKRELFEESGVIDADLIPICDYCGYNDTDFANGIVFLANVHSLGSLPESEMEKVEIFEELPDNLTYPNVTPILFDESLKIYQKLS